MDSIILIIIIIALYVRLYNVKQERNQYKNTLIMKQQEEQK
tara:strand:- start:907 stop:1029 length:123 start_codon:yes stop_codon:yes gene_type:complete